MLSLQLKLHRGSISARAVLEDRIVHVHDVLADPEFTLLESQRLGSYRTALGVPLLREGTAIGALFLTRSKVDPFTQQQIDLVTTFADQAVIAIENVRLFDEVQARTDDLAESLQQQTATADVLKVISRSTFDLQAVLETLTKSVAQLCEAEMAGIARPKGAAYSWATSYGFPPDFLEYATKLPLLPGRGSAVGRVLLEGRIAHIPDVLADPEYAYAEAQRLGGFRTVLSVPLLRQGNPIGVIFLSRRSARPFTDKQIDLATTFADQAVIAIENVRLFDEVQARTDDLSEALEQQTATSDVLNVISRSTFDLQPVLDAIVETASRLCDAEFAIIRRLLDGKLSHGRGQQCANGVHQVRVRASRFRRSANRSLAALYSSARRSTYRIAWPIQNIDGWKSPEDRQLPHNARGSAAARGRADRSYCPAAQGRQAIHREANRACHYVCRSGGDRHREREAVRRGAVAHRGAERIPAAADRHRRRAQGDQPLDLRFADGSPDPC